MRLLLSLRLLDLLQSFAAFGGFESGPVGHGIEVCVRNLRQMPSHRRQDGIAWEVLRMMGGVLAQRCGRWQPLPLLVIVFEVHRFGRCCGESEGFVGLAKKVWMASKGLKGESDRAAMEILSSVPLSFIFFVSWSTRKDSFFKSFVFLF